MNKESYHNDLKNKWKMFVKHGWVATDSTNHVMLKSWQRCLKHYDLRHWNTPVKASGQTLQTIFSRNEEFTRISQRVAEDHFALTDDDRLAFLIIDSRGWVLSLNAIGDYSSQLRELEIESGMSWAEDGIGTNVYSLCRETNLYTQLEGAEHFSEQLHCYAMSATPVIDYYGNIRGYIVCIIEITAELVKLKVSYSCATEIANYIYIESEQKLINKVLCQHNVVIECMDDGLICWNSHSLITMVNSQAQTLLNIDKESLIGQSIRKGFISPPILNGAITRRNELSQKQIILEYRGEFIELMVTLHPLSDGSFLLFLYPLDKIRKIVQQQVSTNVNSTFDSLHAASGGMKQVLSIAHRAIRSISPILINGEEGVGKLSLVMAIHNENEQCDGPFTSVDCQMLSPESILHELLGSDVGPSPSKFELTHNGTLYLDKVEYLSEEVQGVLLKVLKTGLVTRSDSRCLIPIRFRLATYTSSPLREYVQQGAFSRQLYYEISMNGIEIPPLRKRREDLKQMIGDIIDKHQERTRKKVTITPDTNSVLLEYRWLGNISELKDRMEKVFINCNRFVLGLENIPLDIRQDSSSGDDNIPHLTLLAELEMQTIEHTCRVCEWSLAKTAEVLRVGCATLRRKLKIYNLYPNIEHTD